MDYDKTLDGYMHMYGEIRVVDPSIQKNNCSSIPRYPLVDFSFRSEDPYSLSSRPVTFLKCANLVNSSLYVETAPCINISAGTSLSQPKSYGYVKIGYTNASEFEAGCSIEWSTAISSSYQIDQNASYQNIHNALLYGFEVAWDYRAPFCKSGWNRFATCLPYTISGL